MFPHKATVKIWRKSTRKSRRLHIWQLKFQEHPGPSPGPWTLADNASLRLPNFDLATSAKSGTKFLGAPPWQILDLALRLLSAQNPRWGLPQWFCNKNKNYVSTYRFVHSMLFNSGSTRPQFSENGKKNKTKKPIGFVPLVPNMVSQIWHILPLTVIIMLKAR